THRPSVPCRPALLSRALGAAGADSALDAFELSRTAAILIDRHGRVIRPNRSAERLLVDGVAVRDRRVVSVAPLAPAAVDRNLHQLIFSRDGGGLAPPVKLPRPGRRPLLAYPGRIPAQMSNPLSDCRAVVVLVDPDRRNLPETMILRRTFDLT